MAAQPPQSQGLSTPQAQQLLTQHGPNQVRSHRQRAVWLQFLQHFGQPLPLVLLAASLVSAVLGDLVNAGLIAVIVLFSIVLDFAQTYRAQRTAESLQQQVAPTSLVLRDGAWSELPSSGLVPGDLVRLAAGDLVPADGLLLESRDFHVQQALLTGESLPVEKEARPDPPTRATLESACHVFMGSSAVSGTATVQIMATGLQTQFGQLSATLSAPRPETEFERGLQRFSLFILQTVLGLVLLVLLVSLAGRHQPLESLMFAVALAVGLTPEFLPMITTITLANGALRISRRQAIVKNLAAIQNFGSIDILCSDKTGTLTEGVMTLDSHLDPGGQPCEQVLLLAYLNSLYETGFADPHGAAVLQHTRSNPLDAAILQHHHPDLSPYTKLDEVPFDFERRRLSVVVQQDQHPLLITKGAPESVLKVCSAVQINGQELLLSPSQLEQCQQIYTRLNQQGLRVLAVAQKKLPIQPRYSVDDEQDLVLMGFISFADAPLSDAAEVLQGLHQAGVQVKILTGDNEYVAQHVCQQVGLPVQGLVLGHQLEAMSDTALAQMAEHTTVFARVSPNQKNRILLALRRRGHVVGYLGDGINDAPALHTADVGISAAGAAEVARAAADIILLQKGLRPLLEGILEGRRALGNVIKYLLMGTSSNFGNMFSMAFSTVFLPFLPMLPTQILLNNFLYDLAQITIPSDNVDQSFMLKPRRWDISLIRRFMLYVGPISSAFDLLTFWVLLQLFAANEQAFHTGWFMESLATQVLVLFVIRTARSPLSSRPAPTLVWTALAAVAVGLLLPYSPLASLLGFTPMPLAYLGFLAAATAVYLLLVEWVKQRVLQPLLS